MLYTLPALWVVANHGYSLVLAEQRLLRPQIRPWTFGPTQMKRVLYLVMPLSFKTDLLTLFCAYECFPHVCMCTMCVPRAQKGQTRALGPLELE